MLLFTRNPRWQLLLVVPPHGQDFHRLLFLIYLIDDAVLDVDAPRVKTGQIPY